MAARERELAIKSNNSSSGGGSVVCGGGGGGGGDGDIMMTSPPRLERLQLLDYPCTPLSIVRSSGFQEFCAGSTTNDALQQQQQTNGSLRKQHGRLGKAFSRYACARESERGGGEGGRRRREFGETMRYYCTSPPSPPPFFLLPESSAGLARSGPELVRYHSRGTNVNPFSPAERSPASAKTIAREAEDPSTKRARTDPKPRKVWYGVI